MTSSSLQRRKWLLLVADYSQIELRVLAHWCQDPVLLKAYEQGLDLHRMTAQVAYHTEEPTFVQRAAAKNVNFSVIFRVGPQTLVDRYNIRSLREAQQLIDAFYDTYRRVKPWMERLLSDARRSRVTKEQAAERGCKPTPPYVETILGRRRRLPALLYADTKLRSAAERQAINTVVQGSAADINKVALVNVYRLAQGTEMKLLLTVHDEIVAKIPADQADEGIRIMEKGMLDLSLPVPLRVPLAVDIKAVERWSEAK